MDLLRNKVHKEYVDGRTTTINIISNNLNSNKKQPNRKESIMGNILGLAILTIIMIIIGGLISTLLEKVFGGRSRKAHHDSYPGSCYYITQKSRKN